MTKNLQLSAILVFGLFYYTKAQNCDINANASPITITCGQSSVLSAFGSSNGSVILDEDFNSGGFGSGWGSTPGSTNFSNPCSPGGVDGTPHAWMDNNTSVPRTLTSAPYDLSGATAGVTICFDLLFAEQGNAAPCEGPDEPDEGVFLQYSTDGGATWIDITYFDPNGGNDPQLTNWNNWCFTLPAGAITANTIIRWHQTADSGADYDHWGIDNVQIFQNDINSEIEWLHDGYSYGVGQPGGNNPTPVAPIVTTTYTAQITTGAGDVCTADVTVIVIDPVYEVNVSAAPSTICEGDCATITGNAQIVLDPGGIETYENNQIEFVASGEASVNINIQTLNMTGVIPGSIQEICINGFNFSGSELCTNFFGGCNCNGTPISFGDNCDIDASSFNITVTSPNGCEMTLVPANTIVTTGIQDMCFVPSGGALISSGSGNYSGQFDPDEPFSTFDGCDANGVWTLEFNTGTGGFGFGFGSLTGWNITFDDPPIYAPVDISWSPTTDLSNPTSINTDACPTVSTDYELTVSSGTPGCAVHTETVSIIVNPCTGCTPPAQVISALSTCAPGTVSLPDAIGGASDPATLSYHATQSDAQNDVSPIATTVGTSGSYWVRAEDPTDPTCFEVYEIVVTISPLDDASFTLTNYCAGSANSATGIVTAGGTFAFNPVPGGGVTIDPTTGSISDGVAGSTYTVEYTTAGACPASSTETVDVTSQDDASFTLTNYCAGSANSATGIVTAGGTFVFNPVPGGGVTIDPTTGSITNGVSGMTYTVQYTTAGACSASSTETVTINSGFTYNASVVDENCGSGDGEINLTPVGGSPIYSYSIDGGVSTQAGTSFAGLSAANYNILITDQDGCTASGNEAVANLGGPVIDNITPINESCPAACDGTITVAVSGGNPPYSYQWYDGAGAPIGIDASTIDNLCAGNYSVEVSDASGGTTQLFYDDFETGAAGWNLASVQGPEGIDPNYFDVDDDEGGVAAGGCGIATNGDATLHITSAFFPGGGAAYDAGGLCGILFCPQTNRQAESPMINTVGQTGLTLNFDFIAGGDIPNDQATVWYNDGGGWAQLGTPLFSGTGACAPQGIWTAYSSPLPASCENIANLQVAIRWQNNDDGVGTDPSVAINNIEVVTSTVAACTSTDYATLTAPIADDTSFTLTDFCAGAANAATGIVTAGGTFDFNPNPLDGSTVNAATGEITDPVAGTTYTIEYTTPGACPVTSTQTVDAQNCCNIVLDTTSTVSPSCAQADGEINVQAVGGDGNYTYSIDGGPFGVPNSFTGLISGSYDIEVQDGTGTCTDLITVVLSDLNAPIITAVNLTQPLCNGDITGEIEIIANGGTGILTYEIVNGVPVSSNGTGDFTGLGAANYNINVTDANGCSASSNGIIIEPTAVTVDVQYTDVTCFGANDGTIDITGGGGTPTYNYSIDNGATWTTNTNYIGLSPQLYQVIVEDNNGCQSIVEDVTIIESGTLDVTSVIVDESCVNSCDGSITWNVVGGTAPYTYTQNGVNVPSNSVNSLCDGVYDYMITDDSGCATVGSDTIEAGVLVEPSVVSVIPDGCTDVCDGQVAITSNTGVAYTLDGITNGTGLFTDLCEGNKVITVSDANGCTASITVLVTTTPQTIASFTYLPSSVTIFENTVNFTNESTNADQYQWTISGSNGYFVTYNSVDIEHEFPSDTGEYVICLTAINSAGCQDEYCISLVVEDEIVIFVPNSFTPDGDEYNQTFRAYVNGVDLYDFEFLIFNRWGELIWENHDPEIGWDGTYKGKVVPTGSYVWKIVVKDIEFDYRKTYTGHVNML